MANPLDRAWARRPLVSPPTWGRSVPVIWADIEVTFLRRNSSDNGIGGTSGAVELTLLTIKASVSISPEPGLHIEIGSGGSIRRRYYLTIFDIPRNPDFDWDLLPQKGDYEVFYDVAGRYVSVPIKAVHLPQNLGDHVEIESEEFD